MIFWEYRVLVGWKEQRNIQWEDIILIINIEKVQKLHWIFQYQGFLWEKEIQLRIILYYSDEKNLSILSAFYINTTS